MGIKTSPHDNEDIHERCSRLHITEHDRCKQSSPHHQNKINGSSRTSSLSTSTPSSAQSTPKSRHRVRFDETTITRTAEFGETAARFRQISRDRRQRSQPQNSPPQVCFGISKSISIWHDETLDNNRTDSPTIVHVSQSPPDPNKSIFHLNSIYGYSGSSSCSNSSSP